MGNRLLRASFALGLGVLPSSEANFDTVQHNPIPVQDSEIGYMAEEVPADQAEIILHMGQTALEPTLMSQHTKQEIYPDSLVVELEHVEDCAVEYVFSESVNGSPLVSVGLFGKPNDMTDSDKINGSEMFNGKTYGHGDTDGPSDDGMPPVTIPVNTPTSVVEYMEDKTRSICDSFEKHVSDVELDHPN